MSTLKIGKIDYLNVWPMFHLLEQEPQHNHTLIPGHPSFLNACLAQGTIDISPSSAFEYLLHAERYQILPDLSISSNGPVQSVLLVSPVSFEKLPEFLATHGNRVNVTEASATSVALLKILWSQAWKLQEPEWNIIKPGQGSSQRLPFLEIGDLALKIYVQHPDNWHIIDLGNAWKAWTGHPFVFALWIVRRNLDSGQRKMLQKLAKKLISIKKSVRGKLNLLARGRVYAEFSHANLVSYWKAMSYELGPMEQASLALYAHYCHKQGLLPGCPAFNWFR